MLVTPDMRLKVTDFGIARALSTIHPEEQSDVVWGSPQYFSPEQATGAAPALHDSLGRGGETARSNP